MPTIYGGKSTTWAKVTEDYNDFTSLAEALLDPIQLTISRSEFLAEPKKVRDSIKKTKWWTPGMFDGENGPKHRDLDNMSHVSVLGMDIDDEESFANLLFAIDENRIPYNHILYHTANSHEGSRRGRLIIGLEEPLHKDRYRGVMRGLSQHLGVKFIGESKDAARLYFWPVAFTDSSLIEHVEVFGWDDPEQPRSDMPLHIAETFSIAEEHETPEEPYNYEDETFYDRSEHKPKSLSSAIANAPNEHATPLKVADILGKCDPDMGRDDWVKLAMGLHNGSCGEDWAFDMFVEWSQQGEKFENERECRSVWRSIHGDRGRPVTWASVLYLAKPEPPKAKKGHIDKNGFMVSKTMGTSDNARDIIMDVIREGECSCLFAEPGSYKTFIVMEMFCCLATGKDFLGKRTVKGGGLVYLGAEGQAALQNRWLAAAAKHNIPEGSIYCQSMRGWNLNAMANDSDLYDEFVGRLMKIQKDMGCPLRMLALDTLSASAPGEEESNELYSRLINLLHLLQDDFPQLHNLIVHHPGKDADRGARGGSALLGNIDVMIMVKRVAKDEDPPYLSTVQIIPQKERDSEVPPSLGFFKGVLHEFDEQDQWGRPKTTLTLEEGEFEMPDPEAPARELKADKVDSMRELVLKILDESEPSEMKQKELESVCMEMPGAGGTRAVFAEALDDLTNDASVEIDHRQEGRGRPKSYVVRVFPEVEENPDGRLSRTELNDCGDESSPTEEDPPFETS